MSMSSFDTVQHSVRILRERPALRSHAEHVPTLYFFGRVIDAINAGRINEATDALEHSAGFLELIRDDLTPSECEWYEGILQFLRRGIAGGESSAPARRRDWV